LWRPPICGGPGQLHSLPFHKFGHVPFCSLAVLDPRVGHTMDVLSLYHTRKKTSAIVHEMLELHYFDLLRIYCRLSICCTTCCTANPQQIEVMEFEPNKERKCADTIGTVPVPWAGHFHAKISIYFSNEIYRSNFIGQHSETGMVGN